MGKTDLPPVQKTPPPMQDVNAQSAADAAKKFSKGKKGATSTWVTRGQPLGGGTSIK